MSRIIPFKASIQSLQTFDCTMEDVVKTLEVYTEEALSRPGWLEYSVRGIDIYASTFPKKCNNCEKVYMDRQEYLDRTAALNPQHTDSGTIEDQGRIIEYRNCDCGSSLVIVTPCRRDVTPFGMQCREYFDLCVERFMEESQIPPDQAIVLTRVIFREVFNHCLSHKFKAG
ncbi:MAG: hypothetical protein ACOH5I_09645 [Oligoflexus sp.]